MECKTCGRELKKIDENHTGGKYAQNVMCWSCYISNTSYMKNDLKRVLKKYYEEGLDELDKNEKFKIRGAKMKTNHVIREYPKAVMISKLLEELAEKGQSPLPHGRGLRSDSRE